MDLVKRWAEAKLIATNVALVQTWKTSGGAWPNSLGNGTVTLKWLYWSGANDQQPDHDPKNYTSECPTDTVVMFLLAAEPGCFLGCGGRERER